MHPIPMRCTGRRCPATLGPAFLFIFFFSFLLSFHRASRISQRSVPGGQPTLSRKSRSLLFLFLQFEIGPTSILLCRLSQCALARLLLRACSLAFLFSLGEFFFFFSFSCPLLFVWFRLAVPRRLEKKLVAAGVRWMAAAIKLSLPLFLSLSAF